MVAITVFFLLSIAFYAFFAPFLGKDIYEYVALAVYSILVSVLSLLSVHVQWLICSVKKFVVVIYLNTYSPWI